MEPIVIGFIGIGVLLLLMLLGLPIGFSFIVVGFSGLVYLQGFGPSLFSVAQTAYVWASDYTFAAVPLFILMGHFAHHAGISAELYKVGYRWIGRLRGGLAMATVGACGGFAALSGSSMATAAAMGSVALPEMRSFNYSPSLSTGCVAAGGSVGILIPPSIPFIIFGLMTGASISKLFIAGILPGLLEVFLYFIVIYIVTTIDPKAGPAAPSFPWKERFTALGGVWPMLVLFLLIMGAIYRGIATPTEAAAVGAGGSFLFILGKRRLTRQALRSSLVDTGVTTAMILTIFIGAMIFGIFLTLAGLPKLMADWVTALALPKYIILGLILLLYIPLGCIMESLSMIVLTIPMFFPTLVALGISPILLGVLCIRSIEIGQITPPVGLNVFVIKGIAKDVPTGTIFRGIMPFLIADLVSMVLLVAFPQISLFLPSLMK